MKLLVLRHVLGLPVDKHTIVLCSFFKETGLIRARNEGISLLLGSSLLLSTTGAVFHGVASLSSGNHDLEALEIGELSASSVLSHLDIGGVGSPLVSETFSLGSFSESAGSGSSFDVKFNASQIESLERVNNSWELLVGMIDENTNGIEDIDDHDHFAVVFAVIDVTNSTWFNEIFKTL